MRSRPLVSVIMPFLDVEPFLNEAIESVLAQTYPHWELLLVDDGACDGSTRIAQRHAAARPGQIRYLSHPERRNRGRSASRNLAFTHAHGGYIAYLDADDVWLPDKLARQVALLDTHSEVGMVMGASLYWWSWSGRAEDRMGDFVVPIRAPATVVEPPQLLSLLYPLGRGAAPCINALLIRREVVEAVGGWEDSFTFVYDDQAFLAKIYLRYAILMEDACSDRYRQHTGSTAATIRRQGTYRAARKQYLDWFQEHLRTSGIADRTIGSRLARALWPYRHPHLTCALDSTAAMVRTGGARLLPTTLYHRLRRYLRGGLPSGPLLPRAAPDADA